MEEQIPKIDLPEEWIVAGAEIKREVLCLYTNYPVCLKCEMLILCMEGEIEATVNINKVHVQANDFVALMPGSIFQIHRVEGKLKIYALGFSHKYIKRNNQLQNTSEMLYWALGRPELSLKPASANMLEEFFLFLIKVYKFVSEENRMKMTDNLYRDVHTYISLLYKNKMASQIPKSKNELLCRNFMQLVVCHYAQTRNVAWYAKKLGITHAYLCSIVKKSTGNTCMSIISGMVIMNAKSQLKLTGLSVQAISDSLNFADISFFGKYFKRYTGMSPLEYRNKG